VQQAQLKEQRSQLKVQRAQLKVQRAQLKEQQAQTKAILRIDEKLNGLEERPVGGFRAVYQDPSGEQDFDKAFILYTDGSKQMGFGVALHQMGPDGVERPIPFLSICLTTAEINYWPSELETAALIWALQKLP